MYSSSPVQGYCTGAKSDFLSTVEGSRPAAGGRGPGPMALGLCLINPDSERSTISVTE